MNNKKFRWLFTTLTIFTHITDLTTSDNANTYFQCPEDFGYYQHPTDCGQYYVCVFGGALSVTCAKGLMYSPEFKTCDWPRNVACMKSKDVVASKNTSSADSVSPDTTLRRKDEHNILIIGDIGKTGVVRRPKEISDQDNDNDNDNKDNDVKYKTQQFGLKESNVKSIIKEKNDDDVELVGESTIIDEITHKNVVKPSVREKNSFLDSFHGTVPYSASLKNSDKYYSKSDFKNDYVNENGDKKTLDDQDKADTDDFYYVSWDNPIYDTDDDDVGFGDKKWSKKPTANIHLDETLIPQRSRLRYPHLQTKVGTVAKTCNRSRCLLPDCLCGSDRPPAGLLPEEIPQLVILTFDDSVNDLNKELYRDLFLNRKNPNGCSIKATFYVSHEWTDYSQVQNLYAQGHEIASHSISHSYGEQFSKSKWMKEIVGQRDLLAAFGGIEQIDIRGMRAPFLAVGGNNMFQMLYDANFTYDSSMPVYDNNPPPFPSTTDYKMFHDCMVPPCPTKSFPGIWEMSLVMWDDLKGGRCSMADACTNPDTAEAVFKLLMNNFQRHYSTNRSPFGLFYHAAWFSQPHHKEGFENFLDTLLSMEDVWFVSNWQAIQWLRNPSPLQDIFHFRPFNCKYEKKHPPCISPKVCNLWHKSGVRYLRTCQKCPITYPWTGNTGIVNSLVDDL